MDEVIETIEGNRVVQVVINNEANYEAVCLLFMQQKCMYIAHHV